MGNYNFKATSVPKRGQVLTIKDSEYTLHQEIPKSIFYQGSKVKVLGTKKLLCSNPRFPDIYGTLVQLPNGTTEVYISNNL